MKLIVETGLMLNNILKTATKVLNISYMNSIGIQTTVSGLYCIVLYYIDGVVIAAQCTATFSKSIVLPQILILLGREYAD